MAYKVLLFSHVLCFVYWLGGDLGVFYSSRFVASPDQPLPARAMALRIMGWLDLIPRICLVLILPMGLSLIHILFGALSQTMLAIIWVGSIAWLTLAVALYRAEGAAWTKVAARIDLTIRGLVIIAVVWMALQTFSPDGTFAYAPWLGVKLLAFALCVCSGIGIRLVCKDFGHALGAVMAGNPGPNDEATIARCLGRARPFVLAIWGALLVAAWFGLTKPML